MHGWAEVLGGSRHTVFGLLVLFSTMSGAAKAAKPQLNPVAKFYKDSTDLIVKCKKPDAKGAPRHHVASLEFLGFGDLLPWRLVWGPRLSFHSNFGGETPGSAWTSCFSSWSGRPPAVGGAVLPVSLACCWRPRDTILFSIMNVYCSCVYE